MFKDKDKITSYKRTDWEQRDWKMMLPSNITIFLFSFRRSVEKEERSREKNTGREV